MSKEYKFDRNYLKLLIDNKDKLIEVPINDVKLILTYCEILLDRQDNAVDYIKNNTYFKDNIVKTMIFKDFSNDLLEILGDKE